MDPDELRSHPCSRAAWSGGGRCGLKYVHHNVVCAGRDLLPRGGGIWEDYGLVSRFSLGQAEEKYSGEEKDMELWEGQKCSRKVETLVCLEQRHVIGSWGARRETRSSLLMVWEGWWDSQRLQGMGVGAEKDRIREVSMINWVSGCRWERVRIHKLPAGEATQQVTLLNKVIA